VFVFTKFHVLSIAILAEETGFEHYMLSTGCQDFAKS